MTIQIAETLNVIEQTELATLETTIQAGLQKFVEVGAALLRIRDGRLYRAGFGTFENYCRERWGIARRRAYQLMDAAQVVENLTDDVKNFSHRESHVAPLAVLPAGLQREVFNLATETAPNGKVTAAHIESTARRFVPAAPDEDEQELDNLDGEPDDLDWTEGETQASDEYYTPAYIVDAARSVMGAIDLDPATCELAQTVVRAERFYTKADDGLARPWSGRVWLNPPFSNPHPFVMKAIEEYANGNIDEAIVLVNNGTETAWGQALLARFPVCFFGANSGNGTRVAFWKTDPDRPRKGNRYAQMILYLGKETGRFVDVFSRFGPILEPR